MRSSFKTLLLGNFLNFIFLLSQKHTILFVQFIYMKKIISTSVILFFAIHLFAQQTNLYPTNWWVGMKWNKVQILVYNHNKNFKAADVKINYAGVVLNKVTKLENEKYLAVDITVSPTAKAGNVPVVILNGKETETVLWPLAERRKGNGKQFAQGVTSSDLVYLLIPDRFCNAEESNDRIPGLRDQTLNRDSFFLRHGGDLQGVNSKLDYLKDLGVTTLWMTPVLLNDMPNRTEHGYAITNHYKVDERIGGATEYKKLGNELHKRGMKLIQDAVYNHIGLQHFTMQDMPMKDWVHQWPTFTQTTYREHPLYDIHAAPSDTKKVIDGWFTTEMPDINHSNPYVANFLIQHALWSVEEFAIDGWRIDTYLYNDLPFMNKCNKAIMNDFPSITLFGETWVHGVPNQSYFCENNVNGIFKSNLPNTTDFQTLFYGIQPALNEKFGWTDGVMKLYNTTAQDFLYKNPMGQVNFLDNHDLPRFYSVVNENIAKYKIALGWLLTFRGIPQLYYGDEILMTGFTNPDGLVRLDFMGGWKGDKVDKFTSAGRTEKENDVFNYLKALANFRLKSSAIKTGKLMQYLPVKGLYTYFRYDAKQTIMCVMNTGEDEQEINAQNNYAEMVKGFKSMTDIFTGTKVDFITKIKPMEMRIFSLSK
jgi:neopullulanase